ncbi:MAG: uroporphyrinogen-III synthase [Gloeobacteraceae cyanobacterium ES-bin-316]|nr:uroporphyrinogen-III synthase [Ferruginibacter sp.]
MEYATPNNNIRILCTRPLPESMLDEALRLNIAIDVLPFIETESILSVEVQQEIEQAALQTANVVFTSMNAVDAVTIFLDGQQPDWTIYTMGTATQRLVADYFGGDVIAGTGNDAAALAETIVASEDVEEVIFFCGDIRRDELPTVLRKNNIDVNEIVVYQTIATPHRIAKFYHGILFFSPSAVESFFSKNKLAGSTVMFAIGNTTAAELKKYTDHKIIISDEPGKDNLVNKMITYFT